MLTKETVERIRESINADAKSLSMSTDLEEETKLANLIKTQQDIIKTDSDEKNQKWNHFKDICGIVVPVAGKLIGLGIVCILIKKVIGAEMMMSYQDAMMAPKGLKDGEKFLTGVASKRI